MGIQPPTPTPVTSATVTANIRAELARRNLTAATLAEGVGMQRSTAYRRLSGETRWSVDEVDLVAQYLGVTPDSLLKVAV